jgi:hypothetical protein
VSSFTCCFHFVLDFSDCFFIYLLHLYFSKESHCHPCIKHPFHPDWVWTHTASYPVGTCSSFPRGKVARAWSWTLTTLKLRMHGAIPTLPHVYGAVLN